MMPANFKISVTYFLTNSISKWCVTKRYMAREEMHVKT